MIDNQKDRDEVLKLARQYGLLGDQFCREGAFQDARRMYERQIELGETVYGKEGLELVPALLDAADACRSYGRNPAARDFEARALRLLRLNLGTDEVDDARVVDKFCICLTSAGRRDLAFAMQIKAQGIRRRRSAI